MTNSPGSSKAGRSPAQPTAKGGTPPIDPVAVIRSRPYLAALLLAAILGIPISAIAYGFVCPEQEGSLM